MWIRAFMRRFSIRLRMVGAIGVVLLLLLMVGSAGMWGMQRLQTLSHEFVEHSFNETVTLSKLRLEMAVLSRYEKDMVIQYESPEQLSLAHMHWEQTRTEIYALMAAMQEGDADEDNAVLQQMAVNLKEYSAAVDPVVANIKAGGYDSATVAHRSHRGPAFW